MSARLTVAALLLAVCALAETKELSWRSGDGTIALVNRGDIVWQFQYAPTLPKPMFHPVALPGGPALTLDAPADHKWHHAFWFAWKYINGLNYWEERDSEPRGFTSWKNVKIATRTDHSARITLDVEYHPPEQPPVLTERRSIDISAPRSDGEYHFDWRSVFTAGDQPVLLSRTPISGEPKGMSWGGYAGLSWRFAPDLRDWRVAYANGDTSSEPTGKRSVALEVNGAAGSTDAGVAFLDHPKNLNSPSPWHLVAQTRNSFLFAQPAVLYYGEHRLAPKEKLELRYRVIVHTGRWDVPRLKREVDAYTRGELK